MTNKRGNAVIMKDGANACLENCTFSTQDSPGFLGLVMLSNTTATVRGCSFFNNAWGMFVGCSLDDATRDLLLRENDFEDNEVEDITDMFDYDGQRIQPCSPKLDWQA